MIDFKLLLDESLDEAIKLKGGKKVVHDAKWRKAQKKLKKYLKTSKGKRSAAISKKKTSRAGYIPKERIGFNKAIGV